MEHLKKRIKSYPGLLEFETGMSSKHECCDCCDELKNRVEILERTLEPYIRKQELKNGIQETIKEIKEFLKSICNRDPTEIKEDFYRNDEWNNWDLNYCWGDNEEKYKKHLLSISNFKRWVIMVFYSLKLESTVFFELMETKTEDPHKMKGVTKMHQHWIENKKEIKEQIKSSSEKLL